MPKLNLSPEELRKWFEECNTPSTSEGADGYLTVAEIRENTGMSRTSVLLHLQSCKELGILECKRVRKESITGGGVSVPAYRITGEAPSPEQEKKRGKKT